MTLVIDDTPLQRITFSRDSCIGSYPRVSSLPAVSATCFEDDVLSASIISRDLLDSKKSYASIYLSRTVSHRIRETPVIITYNL